MTTQDYLIVLSALLGALFTLSEVLAQIPAIKANSVFQLVYSTLKMLKGQK